MKTLKKNLKKTLIIDLEPPKEEIQKILELATVLGFQTAETMVAIWIEYLTYLKRTTDFTDEKQKDILRNNFYMKWSYLGQLEGKEGLRCCQKVSEVAMLGTSY
jgi:hypothetical protein